MKLLRTRYYRLYGYQGSLPRLPLPPVKDTVRRVRRLFLFPLFQESRYHLPFWLQFMRSVKPFLKKEDYEKMDALSKQFLNSIANRLQFYLMLKSWWSSNYVSYKLPLGNCRSLQVIFHLLHVSETRDDTLIKFYKQLDKSFCKISLMLLLFDCRSSTIEPLLCFETERSINLNELW